MAQLELSMQLTQQSYAEAVLPTVKLSPGTLVKEIELAAGVLADT